MIGNKSSSNGEISSSQLCKIIYLFALGSAALVVPTAIVAIAKEDGWMSMLLATPVCYAVFWIYLALSRRFPKLSLAQYAELILGTWLGKLISLTYIFFFLVLSALVLRNMSDFLGLAVLPQTPDWFISASFMAVVIYAAYLGIETIARTGEILFAWSTLVITVIILTLMNQMQADNFLPMLTEGIVRPIKGMYPVIGFPITECVFMTAILPFVTMKDREKLGKHLGIATLMTGGISTIIIVLLIAVLGVSETVRSPFAVYEMAKSINVEEILVRVEIMFAVVWIGTVFMKLTLTFYSLNVLLAQTLGLSVYRPLALPLGALIVPLSLIVYRNSLHSNFFAMEVWTVYSVLMGAVIPLLLLLAAVVMGKRSERDGTFSVKAANKKVAGASGGAGAGSGSGVGAGASVGEGGTSGGGA